MAKKKMSRKRGGNQKDSLIPNPNYAVVEYRGPTRVRVQGNPDDSVTVQMTRAFSVNGNASLGVQNVTYTSDITSSSTDWTNYSNLYQECRVLGFRVQYDPSFGPGTPTVTHGTGLWVVNHIPGTAIPFTSLNTMVQHQDWSIFNTGIRSSKDWKMSSFEEAQFVPVSAVVSQGNIQWFIPGAISTSVPYGWVYITHMVQFRDRI